MPKMQGLTGLYPQSDPTDTTDTMDEGVLWSQGHPLNSDHSEYGDQSLGYSGTVPDALPYAPQGTYDGYDEADALEYGSVAPFRAAGEALDKTPVTHSSPYPRGIIQDSIQDEGQLAVVAQQALELHSQDLGGPEFYNGNQPTGHEEQTHYTTSDYVAPNENVLSADYPDQLRGSGPNGAGSYGGGNADTTQGYGKLNSYQEFSAGHSIRRVQHDSAHFDFTGTHGEQGVPFPGKHPVQQMSLDGPDSPYFDNGNINGANVVWEGHIGDPQPYEQPPMPDFAHASQDTSDVYAWG
jgi:hypothetical protein